MKKQRTWLAGLALLIGTFVWFGYAQPFSPAKAEKEAVKAAVLDYVEALYNVEPDRIERSVHPELKKGEWEMLPKFLLLGREEFRRVSFFD